MLTMIRRFLGLGKTATVAVPPGRNATNKATNRRLDRTCARAHVNQEASSSPRLPEYETPALVDNPADNSAPIIEPETTSPANLWLEMRRAQGMDGAR